VQIVTAPGMISPDLARTIWRLEVLRRERRAREAIAETADLIGRPLTRAEVRSFRRAVGL
jgi:hypothetical protein